MHFWGDWLFKGYLKTNSARFFFNSAVWFLRGRILNACRWIPPKQVLLQTVKTQMKCNRVCTVGLDRIDLLRKDTFLKK